MIFSTCGAVYYLIWHKSLHFEMFKILSRSLILSAVILTQHFQHPNINSDLYTELVHLHYVKFNLVRIFNLFSQKSRPRPEGPGGSGCLPEHANTDAHHYWADCLLFECLNTILVNNLSTLNVIVHDTQNKIVHFTIIVRSRDYES